MVNVFFRLATATMRLLQRIVGASTVGVRAIVLNDKNEVLLVKHTYSPGWYFPGGGVHKGETASAAIIRELREEVGIIAHEAPQLMGIYFHVIYGVNDYPILFLVKKFSQENVVSPEIAEWQWYAFDKLPQDVTPATQKRLDEYFLQKMADDSW